MGMKLLLPLIAEHAEGKPVTLYKDDAKKKEEKKKEEKKKEKKGEEKKKDEEKAGKKKQDVISTKMTDPSQPGELELWVEDKIGNPGDKIKIGDGEVNEIAPEAKGKAPEKAGKVR